MTFFLARKVLIHMSNFTKNKNKSFIYKKSNFRAFFINDVFGADEYSLSYSQFSFNVSLVYSILNKYKN